MARKSKNHINQFGFNDELNTYNNISATDNNETPEDEDISKNSVTRNNYQYIFNNTPPLSLDNLGYFNYSKKSKKDNIKDKNDYKKLTAEQKDTEFTVEDLYKENSIKNESQDKINSKGDNKKLNEKSIMDGKNVSYGNGNVCNFITADTAKDAKTIVSGFLDTNGETIIAKPVGKNEYGEKIYKSTAVKLKNEEINKNIKNDVDAVLLKYLETQKEIFIRQLELQQKQMDNAHEIEMKKMANLDAEKERAQEIKLKEMDYEELKKERVQEIQMAKKIKKLENKKINAFLKDSALKNKTLKKVTEIQKEAKIQAARQQGYLAAKQNRRAETAKAIIDNAGKISTSTINAFGKIGESTINAFGKIGESTMNAFGKIGEAVPNAIKEVEVARQNKISAKQTRLQEVGKAKQTRLQEVGVNKQLKSESVGIMKEIRRTEVGLAKYGVKNNEKSNKESVFDVKEKRETKTNNEAINTEVKTKNSSTLENNTVETTLENTVETTKEIIKENKTEKVEGIPCRVGSILGEDTSITKTEFSQSNQTKDNSSTLFNQPSQIKDSSSTIEKV